MIPYAPSDHRPGRDIQRPGPHNGECPRPAPREDGLQKPLAERYRRALDRKRASRIARSLGRLQRASPSPTCWESTLPTTIRTARTTRLKRRLPAVVFPLPRREPALLFVARRRLGGLHHRYHWAAQKNGRIDFGELHAISEVS